jgi:hypothetical protein
LTGKQRLAGIEAANPNNVVDSHKRPDELASVRARPSFPSPPIGPADRPVMSLLVLIGRDRRRQMNPSTVCYKRHRFPPPIIAQAVWRYYRFPLSLRLVEEMLLERGIVVSYETIRRWGKKLARTMRVAFTIRC